MAHGTLRGLGILVGLAALLIAPATASAVNPVSFSPAGDMAIPRDGAGAATLPDGRVLVAGGYLENPGSVYLDSTEFYNPSTNSFSPDPRSPPSAMGGLPSISPWTNSHSPSA